MMLVGRVDIGVGTYEAMTPLCGRSVVQVLVIRADIIVTHERVPIILGFQVSI